MKTTCRLALAALLALASAPALAATANSNFQVSAFVTPTCQFQLQTNLSFGAYDPWTTYAGGGLANTATFQYRCSNKLPIEISINAGTNPDASNNRRMIGQTDATQFLAYGLYKDAAHTNPWGSTMGAGGNTVITTGAGGSWVPVTIFGQVPNAQDVAAQSYLDSTVTVTITY